MVLFWRDPAEPGSYPPCPLNAATGLFCPGCGTLRAVHQLLHGQIGRAVSLNVLTVLAMPFIAYHLAAWLVPALPRPYVPGTKATWVLLAVVVMFGVARNLPWAPFTALAP